MKVRVRYRRWDAGEFTQGAVARKLASGERRDAARWDHPPRYEVAPRVRNERTDKVVPIREQPVTEVAEIRPIRLAPPPGRGEDKLSPAELVQGLTHILNPASAFFLALALWRLGADLGLTSEFALTEGPLSHWQVWVAAAGGLQALGFTLRKRFASDSDTTGPTH